MSIEFESLHNLPIADKLRLVEQLWDDIGESAQAAGLQEWHEQEIRRRIADLQAEPESAIGEEELWRRVDRQNG